MRLQPCLLALLAGALLAPAAVQAETVTYCDSFPRQTIRDFQLAVQPFQRPGCMLDAASVVLHITVDGGFYGENTGNCLPGGCSERDSTYVSLAFTDLDGTPVGSDHSVTQNLTLTSYDGVFDFGGTSGYTNDYVWPAYSSYAMTFTSLSQFLSAQSVAIDSEAFWSRTGPGNGSYGVHTHVWGALCVTYTYTCSVGANPSTWAGGKVLYR